MIKVHVDDDIYRRVSELMYQGMRNAVRDAPGFALVENPAFADWTVRMGLMDGIMVEAARSDDIFEVSHPNSMVTGIRRATASR